eukprot:205299-Prymnesium_polylepis.1
MRARGTPGQGNSPTTALWLIIGHRFPAAPHYTSTTTFWTLVTRGHRAHPRTPCGLHPPVRA